MLDAGHLSALQDQRACLAARLRSGSGLHSLFQEAYAPVSDRVGPHGAGENRTRKEAASKRMRACSSCSSLTQKRNEVYPRILSHPANQFSLHLDWRGARLSARSSEPEPDSTSTNGSRGSDIKQNSDWLTAICFFSIFAKTPAGYANSASLGPRLSCVHGGLACLTSLQTFDPW